MISVVFQCDYGPETAQGNVSGILPAGWSYVTLTAFGSTQASLACPLHSQFKVDYVAPTPVIIADQPVQVQSDVVPTPPELRGL